MAAHYVEIEKSEFDELMDSCGFREVHLPRTFEAVYQRQRSTDGSFVVRVYSSIDDGHGRKVGTDAIRVVLIYTPLDAIIWSATRTHRTQGWAERTVSRMREAWQAMVDVRKCPKCRERPLVKKWAKDRSRQFLSCVGYSTRVCDGATSL